MSAIIFTEILHKAGVPKEVFNLVNGDGPTAGEAISGHSDIDMVSFTGPTGAGILVANEPPANSVKRVTQELGGKSANIILPDADLGKPIPAGVLRCFTNRISDARCQPGCWCTALSAMPRSRSRNRQQKALRFGDPLDPQTTMGPPASKAQFDKAQGAKGGTGRPTDFNRGYFARPTAFANVTSDMTIVGEEIFGSVLSMMICENEAVAIANDTTHGLAGYVQGGDMIASATARIRAGRITSTARHPTDASRLATTNNRATAASTGYSVSKNISR